MRKRREKQSGGAGRRRIMRGGDMDLAGLDGEREEAKRIESPEKRRWSPKAGKEREIGLEKRQET